MNFDIPEDLQNYLSVLDDFIEAEIKPLENENDNIRFLTIAEKTREPIGIVVVYPMKNGKRYSARPVGALTRQATIVTRFLRSMAARMVPIWAWRSSVSISPQKD